MSFFMIPDRHSKYSARIRVKRLLSTHCHVSQAIAYFIRSASSLTNSNEQEIDNREGSGCVDSGNLCDPANIWNQIYTPYKAHIARMIYSW